MSNVFSFRTLILVSCCLLPAGLAQAETGYLKTKVSPGRAGVFIDGKYVGPAANFRVGRKYAVEAGEHEVALREPRYKEFTTKIRINGGKTAVLRQALEPGAAAKPPFGRIRVASDNKFDGVFVNGAYMGHADEFSNSAQGLLLNPGDYEVSIVSPGGSERHKEKVSLQADRVVLVRAK